MSSINNLVTEGLVSLASSTILGGCMYYANAEIFNIAPSKSAVIYSVTNSVTGTVTTAVFTAGTVFLGLSALTNAANNPSPNLGNVLLVTIVSGVGLVASLVAGLAAGIFTGKHVAEKTGNPITYKQIAVLTAVYAVESVGFSLLTTL